MKRSTQLRMQGSSYRSRVPCEIFEEMHFLKQVSIHIISAIHADTYHLASSLLLTSQAVNSLLYLRLLAFALNELVQVLSVLGR